ncbi:DUF4328 domain-containing protein [Mycolicibacterium gadium]|uniref:DUF4328 domain-containing protein n=1 Tax=Mycolicibacterium gadium TaxID=1794 RepID=UPI0013D5588D|nr:DUF4328 domain-containing protein [Mycolicibacterium gadium]
MIQVCSTCGTRWNVRDRRRDWCPRCNGALLAPTGPASAAPGAPPSGRRLPPGYRWIAVRPGSAPPPRPTRRPLGPTPRYAFIPRWGLVDRFDSIDRQQQAPQRPGPSAGIVRTTLVATMAVLGAAALAHLVRYALLIVNRSTLLNPWVAGGVTWIGVVLSVIAMFTVVASAVVLTNWLIGRRAAAYAYRGQPDPRSLWSLRAGCLVPVVNLAWAPVFVIELAGVEERFTWLRRSIAVWWLVWVASTAVSVFSIATSFATEAQAIADNTVTTTVAYLLALAAVLLAMKVFDGFERQPVEKPSKRWVIVPDAAVNTETRRDTEPENAAAVESEGQNPAA